MKIRFGLLFAFAAIILEGCASAPQQAISLSPDSVNSHSGRIGVVMTALPKIDTQFPGAGCLLCYAAASMANSSLTAYTHKLTYEDIPKLKNEAANLLIKKGADVAIIEENLDLSSLSSNGSSEPNSARKDFSSFKAKYKIDKLLVIDITSIGFIRTYSNYIPTSDPKGVLQGSGYLVNLSNNKYEWYQPIAVMKSADQKWDEPPTFPGLTNAYYQALAIGKDNLLQPLAAINTVAVKPANIASDTSAKGNAQ